MRGRTLVFDLGGVLVDGDPANRSPRPSPGGARSSRAAGALGITGVRFTDAAALRGHPEIASHLAGHSTGRGS